MFDKLEAVETRFVELEGKLADPDVIARRAEFQKLSKEHADISELVAAFRRYKLVQSEREANRPLDRALGNEMRDLGEVAARPGEPHSERFRPGLVSPLDAPEPAATVPRRDARLRSGEMLRNECERRHRRAFGSARTVPEVEPPLPAGIAPDPVPGGPEVPRTCPVDAPDPRGPPS